MRQIIWPQTHGKQFNVRPAHTLLHNNMSKMTPLDDGKPMKFGEDGTMYAKVMSGFVFCGEQ